jgi:1-aminocyclopropane-1-carboxylate deaminase
MMITVPTPLQKIESDLLTHKSVNLFVKRDDLTNPYIQGNKWRKLKYNLERAQAMKCYTLLTFGGPKSNHIYATAAAGKAFGFKTIGVIRGYENLPLTSTLTFAKEQGMEFVFLSKSEYPDRFSDSFLEQMKLRFGDFFMIPDGGTNEFSLKGVGEMVAEIEIDFDMLVLGMGTGGTLAGCAKAAPKKRVIGFSSLLGEGLDEDIKKLIGEDYSNWTINKDYHFGGYAKMTDELASFIASFQQQYDILLDPVYTSKMLYGVMDLISKDYFAQGTTIVVVHTGGLHRA